MHMETFDFPTFPEDFLVVIVLLFLRTNKPIRMDFLSIFSEDFRVLEKWFLFLKSCAQKVQVIMAHCRPNFKLLRSCFHSEHGEITALGFKIERKNSNQCLGGLRTENQGIQSPQTFLLKTFFFSQSP